MARAGHASTDLNGLALLWWFRAILHFRRLRSGVRKTSACLVDVYETLVAYDFEARLCALAALAGADPLAWQQDQLHFRTERDRGLVSTAESFRLSLSACGIDPSPQLVSNLTLADRDLMVANSRPYDDAVPFLRQLRSNGIKIALVSNCADNTRTLLTDLNLAPLSDHIILSCEIGFAKPSPEIYAYALETLGTPPEDAVMVDDLEEYCKGAEAAGVKAIQITRNGQSADSGFPAVRSLLDVLNVIPHLLYLAALIPEPDASRSHCYVKAGAGWPVESLSG